MGGWVTRWSLENKLTEEGGCVGRGGGWGGGWVTRWSMENKLTEEK